MTSELYSFTKSDTSKVKGLAIILMVIHHCFLGPERYQGQIVDFYPLNEHIVNYIALSFKICVAIFVFLSAYGITLSYKRCSKHGLPSKQQVLNLTLKRLVSLIGGYLFVFLFVQLWSILVVRDGRFSIVYGKGIQGILYFFIDSMGLGELFSTPMFLATFWYMSLAFLIVVLMPLLLSACERYGTLILFALAVLFRVLFIPTANVHYAYLPNYLAVMVAGIWAAQHDSMAMFKRWVKNRGGVAGRVVLLLLLFVITGAVLVLRQKTRYTALLPIWDSIIPLSICCIMHTFINDTPIFSNVFDVLGKYSMDIFLIHNFIRIVWYYDFAYSFSNWILITFVLIVVSLAISVVLEKLKSLIRYDHMLLGIRSYCDTLCE